MKYERELAAGKRNFPLEGKIKTLKAEYAKIRNRSAWINHLAR